MSHEHEHAHSHDGHQHHHHHADNSDATLTRAMAVFGVVGLTQVTLGCLAGHVALAVEGAHNAAETPILGFNRWAHRQQQAQPRSPLVTCWLLPLAPALSALPVVAAAAVFFFIESKSDAGGVWLAFALAALSLVVNLYYAARLHQHNHGHGEADMNVVAAKLHLLGDGAASVLVVLAYAVIALTGGNLWLDQAAAIAGVAVIVLAHVRPVVDSLRSLARHRRPVHEGCANGASPR